MLLRGDDNCEEVREEGWWIEPMLAGF